MYRLTLGKYGKPLAIHKDNNKNTIVRLLDSTTSRKVANNSNDIDKLINTKKLKPSEIKELQTFINKKRKKTEGPEDEKLKEIYDEILEQDSKELSFNTGELFFLPPPKKRIRLFASGATGAGKTYWISNFLESYKEIYPDRKIYLFSDVESDPLLDKHGVVRIKLNSKLVDKPIETSLLEDSLTIFDDIDSILDSKIKKSVMTLYNAILKKGSSHDNIDLIVTSHAN